MDSKHLLDPELADLLKSMPQFELSDQTLPGVRADFATMMAETPRPPSETQVESFMIPGPAGAPQVRALLYKPADAQGALPAILHIHGGGYVLGAPEMADAANRLSASELGCVIVSVDYRLAPETCHPGPLRDCYAALAWLHGNAGPLGVDAARIGVKGESAGGGLAAALALYARDQGGPGLAFQHLIYPMIDDRTCTNPDPHPFTGEFTWTPAKNAYGWSSLLGMPPGSPGVSAYAAVARAEQLAGLPPAFIAVGALDLFLEENLAYARRLTRAGVPAELHLYPGAFHGFHMAPGARVTQAAERDSREALRRSLHG